MKSSNLKTALVAIALFLVLSGFFDPEGNRVDPETGVDYVRVVDAFGAGFYYIPGTETTLRVGGYSDFTNRARINFDSRICADFSSGSFTLPRYPRYDPNYVDDAVDALDDLTNSEFLAVMDWWWGDGPNPYYLGLGNPAVGRAMNYLWDASEAEGWDIWDDVADRDEYLYYARQNRLWIFNRLAMNWGRIGLPLMMAFNPAMVMLAKTQLDNLNDLEFNTVMNWLWGEGSYPLDNPNASQNVRNAVMSLFWLNGAEIETLIRATEERDDRILNQVWAAEAFLGTFFGPNVVAAQNPFGKTSYNPTNVLIAKRQLDNLTDREFLAVMDWLWDDGPNPLAIGYSGDYIRAAMGSLYRMTNAEIWHLVKLTEKRDDRLLEEADLKYGSTNLGAVILGVYQTDPGIIGSGARFAGNQGTFQKIDFQATVEGSTQNRVEATNIISEQEDFSPRVGLTYQIQEGLSVKVGSSTNFSLPYTQTELTSEKRGKDYKPETWANSNIQFKIEESVGETDQSKLNAAENTIVKLGFPIPEKPVPGNTKTDEGSDQDPVQGNYNELKGQFGLPQVQFADPWDFQIDLGRGGTTEGQAGDTSENSIIPELSGLYLAEQGIIRNDPGEGSRGDSVRYVSPTFAGFSLNANWGEDDIWDVALRYAGEFGSIRLAAGVNYTDYDEQEKAPDGDYSSVLSEIQHTPTGLFVSGEYGKPENPSEADLNNQALGNFAELFLDKPSDDPKTAGQPQQPLGKRPDSARTNWAMGSRWDLGVGYNLEYQANYQNSKILYTDEDSKPEDLGDLYQYSGGSFKLGGFNISPIFYAREDEEKIQNSIGQNPNILDNEKNSYREKLADDPYFKSAGSWGQNYPDQWAIQRVGYTDAPDSAWVAAGENLTPVIVAVIDSGIDWNHADISWDSLWLNEDEIDQNGIDDDGNGYIDDVVGWDFYYNTNLPWDEDGHGTFVAGVIAARSDNGIGISGINPAAKIMVLKALDNFGHTKASYVAEAIKYAVDNGARVINLSVGGRNLTKVEKLAVDYAWEHDVLVVAAAGNHGENAETYGLVPYENVIAVSSLNFENEKSNFSNWGEGIDLAAPGEDVLSLRARRTDLSLDIRDLDYTLGENYVGDDKRYYRAAGTSFSTPIVAGTASLILSKNPNLTAAQVRRMLLQNARDIDVPGKDQFTGYGLLDAKAALAADPDFEIVADIKGVEVIQDAGVFVAVNGTANANQFGSAQIYIGEGENPSDWKAVGKGIKKAVEGGRLDLIPATELQGTPLWIIRLVVTHRNGQTREERFVLNLG